jgi:hypothetical protein
VSLKVGVAIEAPLSVHVGVEEIGSDGCPIVSAVAGTRQQSGVQRLLQARARVVGARVIDRRSDKGGNRNERQLE